jgi:hypothetical protein
MAGRAAAAAAAMVAAFLQLKLAVVGPGLLLLLKVANLDDE